MAELPRLEQWAPISVVPRPTPNPEAASLVQRTLAQGAGQMEQILGHITAKDIESRKAEQTASLRLAAENAVHDQFTSFVDKTDKVRTGQLPDDEGNPVKTDDLMTVYGRMHGEHRQAGIDSLKSYGPLAQYAFANEFDSLSASHLQKLHTDRDKRKIGDLQGGFDTQFRNIIDYTAHGDYDVKAAERKYRDLLDDTGSKIFTPEQKQSRLNSDIKAIHLAPYYQKIATGYGPTLFEEIERGKIKDLSGEELLDLRAKVMDDNWKVSSKQAADYTAQKRDFDDKSSKVTVSHAEEIRQGLFRRDMLEQESPNLNKEDYKYLDTMMSVQEHAGGPGNGMIHASDKLDIAMSVVTGQNSWSPERIKARVAATGMNPTEGLDLLNEWYKAKQQAKNTENDPSHFSKDHRFKMYFNGIERNLGVSPFSILKPQDQSIVQQAKYDYYNTFQLRYDAKQPLPDFETENIRIVERYKNQMSWELEPKSPYGSWDEVKADYERGKISRDRANELGRILMQIDKASRKAETEKSKK